MDKRGQLYLLAALLIGFILFLLILPANEVRQTVLEDKFTSLAHNFDRESVRFLNSLIEHQQEVSSSFLNFTVLFTSYSKTKNQDFGLLYLFIYNNTLYVGNYLHDPISFTFQGTTVDSFAGCFASIEATLSLGGLTLPVSVPYTTFQQCQKILPVSSTSDTSILITLLDPAGAVPFHIDVTAGNPEIVIISKEQRDQTRKIYVKGTFI